MNDDSAPGYRSLRELAAESGLAGEKLRTPAARPNRAAPTQPDPAPPLNGRPPAAPATPAGPNGPAAPNGSARPAGGADRPVGRHRRRTFALVVVLVLAVVLGTGGYLGYRELAPYFGGGYRTGASATVTGVKLTVSGARCGLKSAPDSPVKPVGQFCTVEVQADNHADDGAFIDFRDWSVNLDVGIRNVGPTVNAMQLPVAVVLKGHEQTLDLVFDVPTGARLSALNVKIGIRADSIPMSIAG
jgi:hypothetical protein